MTDTGLIPPTRQRRTRIRLAKSKEDLAFEAGVSLASAIKDSDQDSVFFPINVSYSAKEKFKVPFTEASMHYGIAQGRKKG
jgi:hypothetical protein